MTEHKVVSREEWASSRDELLAREKEHTRLGDELARQRRELPWVRVEKEYVFDTAAGCGGRRTSWGRRASSTRTANAFLNSAST